MGTLEGSAYVGNILLDGLGRKPVADCQYLLSSLRAHFHKNFTPKSPKNIKRFSAE